ncbi:MAG: hypothetical protein M3313_01250 [Actinomycetota bacterium]|nr:hypothetical protein [Actinomycetota bacterium]
MRPDPVLVAAAVAFAGASAYGSAVAARHDIPGEPFGISIPLSVPTGLVVGCGAGVAAPWPMPVTALTAALYTGRTHRSGVPGVICSFLGLCCIAGTLVEPVTYRPGSWTLHVRAAIGLNIVASILLTAAGRRSSRVGRRRPAPCV